MTAAIFDMDGTLLDSMGCWLRIVPDFLREQKISLAQRELLKMRHMGLLDAARFMSQECGVTMSAQEMCHTWDRMMANYYQTEVKPKPFVPEYLQYLKDRGIRMAVATLTPHAMAEPALERHGLHLYFDYILTTQDVGGVPKSEPDLFLEAARRLSAEPADCVVFEDSFYAIKAAVGAGFPTYGIADFHAASQEEAIRSLCKRYIKSFAELLPQNENYENKA